MIVEKNIASAIQIASTKRSRLVIVRSQWLPNDHTHWTRLNLNLTLSESLLSFPQQQRARLLPELFGVCIVEAETEVVVLTGIEILFDRSLAIDPLRLLRANSSHKTLLVCWPGDIRSSGLSYGIPSHPEHRIYKASDLRDVIYCDAANQ